MVDDNAAASLILRFVDATDASGAGDHNYSHNSDECTTIIEEMKVFLSTGWKCGKGCGFSGSYRACSVHEDKGCDQCHSNIDETNASALYFSIGSDDDDQHVLLNDDEIDLSSSEYTIGDTGFIALCDSLTSNIHVAARALCVLDLEANGLSSVGGLALAAALQEGVAPNLKHLNLGCNGIGRDGAIKLAATLHCCPLLLSLDLHGNAVGDDGCMAIGAALSAGAVPSLDMLDLSANRIEDRGCMALAPLFGGWSQSCCPLMTRLNLRENGIESSAVLFVGATIHPSFVALDLSWNCIANFEALLQALVYNGTTSIFPSLLELNLKGNSLSDASCARLCTALRNCGTAPKLIVEAENETIEQGDDCEVSEGRLRSCLQLLADGDATNSRVCCLALWENSPILKCVDEQIDEGIDSTKHRLPSELFNEMFRRDGFVVQPPTASGLEVAHLARIMERLESAGWPPVFCFMSDAVWDFVVAKVWPIVRDLLGEDCVLDAGSAFAWSLKATGKSTFPRDGEFRSWQNAVSRLNTTVPKERDEEGHRGFGSSFGLPHRDYSAAESLYHEGEDEKESPEIITVWIPLNDATLDNGCMYVVPREFDTDFARIDNHHAHMNPATEVQRGLSSKIHFPLHGVRALPAPAGSLLAWYGNTIHWGSTCSRYAQAPRKSIALTFRRIDNTIGTKETPPITMTQVSSMTLKFRLALISRSLLLYNQWHALADDAVPPLIYETTVIPEKRQRLYSR